MAAGFFAQLGNTLGVYLPYECPHCKTTRRISEYGGNIIEGAVCPSCGKDPTPPKVADYLKEHQEEFEGELTEEKQKQLLGTAYKFLGADGKIPDIQQIITNARIAAEATQENTQSQSSSAKPGDLDDKNDNKL